MKQYRKGGAIGKRLGSKKISTFGKLYRASRVTEFQRVLRIQNLSENTIDNSILVSIALRQLYKKRDSES